MATKTEFVAGKPTPTQADALLAAIASAYDAGWKGSLRERMAPRVERWTTRPTMMSMRSKGLVELVGGRREANLLTKAGVAVAEKLHRERIGVSAEDAAEGRRERKREKDQALQDRVDHAKHLWRGLSLHRGFRGGKNARAKKMATHIDKGYEVRLNLEDLLKLGEQIEKLR